VLRIDEIKDDLRKDEGLSLKVYRCPAGMRMSEILALLRVSEQIFLGEMGFVA